MSGDAASSRFEPQRVMFSAPRARSAAPPRVPLWRKDMRRSALRPRPGRATGFPAGAVLRIGEVTDAPPCAMASGRELRRARLLPRVAQRRAGGCLGDRSSGPCDRPGGSTACRRSPRRAALGDLRAEAEARLPACQARLREDAGGVGPRPFDRAAHCLFQVDVRPDRARQAPASPSCCSATGA